MFTAPFAFSLFTSSPASNFAINPFPLGVEKCLLSRENLIAYSSFYSNFFILHAPKFILLWLVVA